MATLLERNKPAKAIKNLGWLLRNADRVHSLGINVFDFPAEEDSCELVANLTNGGTYICDFRSFFLCVRWINRPVFFAQHLEIVNIFGGQRSFLVGGQGFNVVAKGTSGADMRTILGI